MNLYDDSNETTETQMTMDEFNDYEASVKELVGKAEMSAKLHSMPEFNEIVVEDYFQKEPIRLAQLMTSGRITPKQFDECVEDLRSIGHFQRYLRDKIESGNIAQNELAELKETREQFLLEQANA